MRAAGVSIATTSAPSSAGSSASTTACAAWDTIFPPFVDASRATSARAISTRTAVAAAAVRLIGEAFFRVGSERYERDNGTFGLTTLRKSHVTLRGERVQFDVSRQGRRFGSDRSSSTDVSPASFVG